MLGVFHNSLAKWPGGLKNPDSDPNSTAESLKDEFRIRFDFGVPCFMAYSSPKQGLLLHRQFAAVDNINCLFIGQFENMAQLMKLYGLTKMSYEPIIVIEAYRALRDRGPHPVFQVLRGMIGKFAFILFDSSSNSIFIASGVDGSVPFFWGIDSKENLVVSDNEEKVKKGCGRSYAPFPKGCFFTSSGGLRSYEEPFKELKGVEWANSLGQICGAAFEIDEDSKREIGMPKVSSESEKKTRKKTVPRPKIVAQRDQVVKTVFHEAKQLPSSMLNDIYFYRSPSLLPTEFPIDPKNGMDKAALLRKVKAQKQDQPRGQSVGNTEQTIPSIALAHRSPAPPGVVISESSQSLSSCIQDMTPKRTPKDPQGKNKRCAEKSDHKKKKSKHPRQEDELYPGLEADPTCFGVPNTDLGLGMRMLDNTTLVPGFVDRVFLPTDRRKLEEADSSKLVTEIYKDLTGAMFKFAVVGRRISEQNTKELSLQNERDNLAAEVEALWEQVKKSNSVEAELLSENDRLRTKVKTQAAQVDMMRDELENFRKLRREVVARAQEMAIKNWKKGPDFEQFKLQIGSDFIDEGFKAAIRSLRRQFPDFPFDRIKMEFAEKVVGAKAGERGEAGDEVVEEGEITEDTATQLPGVEPVFEGSLGLSAWTNRSRRSRVRGQVV